MISIIVPTYNEEKNIVRCLRSLDKQSLLRKDYEIIVVDGHSKDRTVELAKKYADKVILQNSKGVGGARNDGVAVANGGIIATTDADCIVHESWLEEILNSLNRTGTVCVLGPLMQDNKEMTKYKVLFYFSNKIMYITNKFNVMHFVCGANVAFKKQPFEDIGGFSNLPMSDDFEIGIRIKKKGKIIFNENMRIYFNLRRLKKQGIFRSAVCVHINNLKILFGLTPDKNINYAKQNYDE